MPSAINDVLYNVVEAYNRKETWVAENEKREPEYIPKFSSHILRHTACTNNCNAGMNVKVLQYLMGHKNIETTLGVYTHVDEIDASEEVRRLEENTVK